MWILHLFYVQYEFLWRIYSLSSRHEKNVTILLSTIPNPLHLRPPLSLYEDAVGFTMHRLVDMAATPLFSDIETSPKDCGVIEMRLTE